MLTCFQKYEYISSRFITKSNDVAHAWNATYARVCTQQHYYLFLLRNNIAYNLLFSYSGKCNVIDTACVPGTRFLFIFFPAEGRKNFKRRWSRIKGRKLEEKRQYGARLVSEMVARCSRYTWNFLAIFICTLIER